MVTKFTLAAETMKTDVQPKISLSDKDREGVVQILSTFLADEYVLYTKTRNYHWNIVGPQFNDLHKFFEEQYERLNEIVDDVAERIRTLGGNRLLHWQNLCGILGSRSILGCIQTLVQ